MENKSGTNLAELIRLRRNAPFPPQEALVFLKAISASLAYIHGRGLVHGDIKPENVTIDPQGKVFLSGVGFAQPIGSKSTVRRPVEYVPHLAPELIGEEIVTEATDVFSLGVLYYQIITGEIPSPGAKSLATPHQLNPSISESLSQVVMRSFAQYPLERYATPQEFFAAVCDTLRVAADQVQDHLPPPRPPSEAETLISKRESLFSDQATMVGGQRPVIPPREAPAPVQQTVVIPSASPVYPAETPASIYDETAGEAPPSRPAWLWWAVGGVGLILLLCIGYLVGTQLPALLKLISPQTPTATYTASPSPSLSPLPSNTLALTDTPGILPAISTDTPLPPPTLPPPPTDTSLPPPTFTSPATGGSLQVRNRFPFPLYVFRGNRLLNTGPIPTGMYLIFFNQPPGTFIYSFCQNPNMTNCQQKEITISGDVSITVP